MEKLRKHSSRRPGRNYFHFPHTSCHIPVWPIAVYLLFCSDILGRAGAGPASGGAGSAQNALPGPGAASRGQPYFDAVAPRNVTALVGKSAYLTCKVKNLGNKTVSWIRHRDLHILTVASYTYSSDQRFQTTHHKEAEEWTLHIKWAQQRDAGMYECQVSTQPVRSYFVNLNVVDWNAFRHRTTPRRKPISPTMFYNFTKIPRKDVYRMYADQVPTATILGGPDLHVDKGSTINLTCSIRFSPEPPAYIFWYHHDEVISYDSARGGVSVVTERGDVTTSRLLVQNADLPDSGKYSCSPSNAEVASIRVHVLNGERPAAMQTGSAGLSSSARHILPLLLLPVVYERLRGIDR